MGGLEGGAGEFVVSTRPFAGYGVSMGETCLYGRLIGNTLTGTNSSERTDTRSDAVDAQGLV